MSNFPLADSSVTSSSFWNKVLNPQILHKLASAWHHPMYIPCVPVTLADFLFSKYLPASERALRLFSLLATLFCFPPLPILSLFLTETLSDFSMQVKTFCLILSQHQACVRALISVVTLKLWMKLAGWLLDCKLHHVHCCISSLRHKADAE